jgi:hypothetical protein
MPSRAWCILISFFYFFWTSCPFAVLVDTAISTSCTFQFFLLHVILLLDSQHALGMTDTHSHLRCIHYLSILLLLCLISVRILFFLHRGKSHATTRQLSHKHSVVRSCMQIADYHSHLQPRALPHPSPPSTALQFYPVPVVTFLAAHSSPLPFKLPLDSEQPFPKPHVMLRLHRNDTSLHV